MKSYYENSSFEWKVWNNWKLNELHFKHLILALKSINKATSFMFIGRLTQRKSAFNILVPDDTSEYLCFY